MPKQFILNKNKSIGKVIYIVEGGRKEFTLTHFYKGAELFGNSCKKAGRYI